ncbi:unnamed protein product, partial [Mesorhabditis belari]|uniref:Uncharacterized protein n=1 Tax=Mesorhabditis belari TaxID=2138241 RepID=A0AAF3FAR6_9BILA
MFFPPPLTPLNLFLKRLLKVREDQAPIRELREFEREDHQKPAKYFYCDEDPEKSQKKEMEEQNQLNSLTGHFFLDALCVARRCPLLEDFTVSGCKSVTSHSALSLLESSRLRKPTMLTTHMENTSFDVNQLYRQIQSPYFCEPGTWKLMPMTIRIGYEKAAVMAQSTNQTCVLIYV